MFWAIATDLKRVKMLSEVHPRCGLMVNEMGLRIMRSQVQISGEVKTLGDFFVSRGIS